MKTLKTFIGGILAGISIAVGGTVYLSLENKTVGALLFTVGLFTVCSFGLKLFTGKVCYVFSNGRSYALQLIPVWLGNLFGTTATAELLRLTRIGGEISQRAAALCETKLSDSPLSIFILAIFCNILIYIGVEGFATCQNSVGKYLALIFGVTVFILCGFEHCVANMFYFAAARAWSVKSLIYLLIMTFGNSLGGVIFPLLRKAASEKA